MIDECFSKDTVEEIVKSLVSFSVFASFEWMVVRKTACWSLTEIHNPRFGLGSGSRQRRKCLDWCSAQRLKKNIPYCIENDTKIGNRFFRYFG